MHTPLESIRDCFEGLIPSTIATCAPDGTPNITYLSHVNYVDREHIALSFMFFNKTRRNIALNPRIAVMVVDSRTCRQYLLDLVFVRTEASGSLFEQMRVKIDGIASMTGTKGVFALRGVDIFKVLECRPVDAGYLTPPPRGTPPANALNLLTAEIGACEDMSMLFDVTLKGLAQHLHFEHAMILIADPARTRLYTVASIGYATSGAGAEVSIGDGVIGVAATERRPIRITHMGRELMYDGAIRRRVIETGGKFSDREIKLPGLPNAQSQIAIPVRARNQLLGVLYLESPELGHFLEHDETTLVAIANHLGTAILLCGQAAANAAPSTADAKPAPDKPQGKPLVIRRFEADQSVFIDDDYLIKGVAGAILWRLMNSYSKEGRTEFSNRELRLDASIRLPDITDNLEARLVLLTRRLQDRSEDIRLEKVARGRVRLVINRPFELQSIGSA
jgi:adenylate cyclase